MTDATAKLSELLSAARERRTMDDALGVPRRAPSTKTLLCTTNARSYLSANSFIQASYDSLNVSDPGGEESPDLVASMRLVRSYAAKVKQLPPSPETTAFPPSQLPQGDSFIDRSRAGSFRDRFVSPEAGSGRDRGSSFRKERLRLRQSLASPPPSMSRERCPEPSSSILRAKYFLPERAPSGNDVLLRTSSSPERVIADDSPPPRPRSDVIRPSLRIASPPPSYRRASTGCMPTGPAASHRRLPTLLHASENAAKTPSVAAPAFPAARHVATPRRRRRSSTSDVYGAPVRQWEPLAWLHPEAAPPAPFSSKRLLVRGGARR